MFFSEYNDSPLLHKLCFHASDANSTKSPPQQPGIMKSHVTSSSHFTEKPILPLNSSLQESPIRENPLAHNQQPAQFAHTKVQLRDVRGAQITMTQQQLTESESQPVSPLNKLVSHPLQHWQGSRAAPGVERAENSVGLVLKSATA